MRVSCSRPHAANAAGRAFRSREASTSSGRSVKTFTRVATYEVSVARRNLRQKKTNNKKRVNANASKKKKVNTNKE